MPTSTVFVAGSRQISRLPAEVRARLDTVIEKGFQILVGDANGADKAVQRYLAAPSKRFLTIRALEDLKYVLANGDPASVERLVSDLRIDVRPQRAAG
ncbi:MAG: hypothetical protein ACRD2N_24500 [Vicinamibacterales bacterium]